LSSSAKQLLGRAIQDGSGRMKCPKRGASDDETFFVSASNIDTLVTGQRSSWENKRGGIAGLGRRFEISTSGAKSEVNWCQSFPRGKRSGNGSLVCCCFRSDFLVSAYFRLWNTQKYTPMCTISFYSVAHRCFLFLNCFTIFPPLKNSSIEVTVSEFP
jgi:hypothetical protein